MSNKCFKIEDTCPDKVQAPCVEYQGKLGENSKLEEGCLTIEDTIEDLYNITDTITGVNNTQVCDVDAEDCGIDTSGLLDEFGNPIISIGQLLKYLLSQVKQTKDYIQSLTEDVEDLEDKNTISQGQINNLNNSNLSLTQQVNTLKSESQWSLEQIDTLNQNQFSVQQQMEGIQGDVDDNVNELSNIKTDITNVIDITNNLSGDITKLYGKVDDLDYELNIEKGKVVNIQDAQLDLDTDLGIAQSQISLHNSEIVSLKGRMTVAEQDISNLQNNI